MITLSVRTDTLHKSTKGNDDLTVKECYVDSRSLLNTVESTKRETDKKITVTDLLNTILSTRTNSNGRTTALASSVTGIQCSLEIGKWFNVTTLVREEIDCLFKCKGRATLGFMQCRNGVKSISQEKKRNVIARNAGLAIFALLCGAGSFDDRTSNVAGGFRVGFFHLNLSVIGRLHCRCDETIIDPIKKKRKPHVRVFYKCPDLKGFFSGSDPDLR